jgi:hypothetical protein
MRAVSVTMRDPSGRYSQLTPDADGVRIEHCALEYHHAAAATAMRRAGLPADYRDALANGLWPSCDVLPARETQQQGLRLTPGSLLWAKAVAAPHQGQAARRRRLAILAGEETHGCTRDRFHGGRLLRGSHTKICQRVLWPELHRRRTRPLPRGCARAGGKSLLHDQSGLAAL